MSSGIFLSSILGLSWGIKMIKKKTKIKPKKKARKQPKKKRVAKVNEYEEFIRFMALPRTVRMKDFGFANLGEFAKKYKIHPGTLSEWQKRDGFWENVKKLWKEWGRGRTPEVVLGLYRKAVKEGNASEAIAWFKLIEDWQERKTIDIKSEDLKKMRVDMRKIADSIKDQK